MKATEAVAVHATVLEKAIADPTDHGWLLTASDKQPKRKSEIAGKAVVAGGARRAAGVGFR